MSLIEIIAAVFGVLSVWLTARQNIWCWPTGLVMVVLYAIIFFNAKLYSDTALQVIYIALCIYGWVHWSRRGQDESPLKVTRLSTPSRILWSGVGIGSAISLGLFMDTQTNAALPYWDAATTTFSLVAQYLLTRKKLESWVFWIVVDAIAVGVYTIKELYVTAGLYALFLSLAITGFLIWHKSLRKAADSSLANSCLPTADINYS